jgi:hypothetical protein
MESPGTHFHVVGLQNDAALLRPVFLQCKNEILKGAGWLGVTGHRMLTAKAKAASIATPPGCVLGFTAHSNRSQTPELSVSAPGALWKWPRRTNKERGFLPIDPL